MDTINPMIHYQYKWSIYRKICVAWAKGCMLPANKHLTWLFDQEEHAQFNEIKRESSK